MQVRRPRGPDDAEALFDLVAVSDTADLGYVDYEIADAVEELTRPGLDLSADAWLATGGDRVAGYASAVRQATGAFRLYESVGMRTGTVHDCYQLMVPAGEPGQRATS